MNLTATRTLVEFIGATADNAHFCAVHDDDHPRLHLRVEHATWQDMGEPSELTVTIEPGDHLNP